MEHVAGVAPFLLVIMLFNTTLLSVLLTGDATAQSAVISVLFPLTFSAVPIDWPPDSEVPKQNRKPFVTLSSRLYGSGLMNVLFPSPPLRMQ
jgi:hypothetical protein